MNLRYIFGVMALPVLMSLAACQDNDDLEHIKDATPLTTELLRGEWTLDIDGNEDVNFGTLLYDFANDGAYIRSTIIDIDGSNVFDYATPMARWSVVPDYLPEPNEYGHREAVVMTIGDEQQVYYVKDLEGQCVDLYLLGETNDKKTFEVPFRLVRKDAVGNNAQPIEMTTDEVKNLIDEYTANATPIPSNRSKWMKDVDGRRLVCDLAIPGTHDSSTSGVNLLLEFSAKTQDYNLGQQWDMGVRAFDLRVRNYKDYVEMCHGPIPCNMAFKEAFATILDRVIRDDSEFAMLFINTESNPINIEGALIEYLATFLTAGIMEIRQQPLDEKLTRDRVYNDIKALLKDRHAEDRICYYRPDLTLDEARGKIIIFNHVPSEYDRSMWPFVGQAIVKNKDLVLSDAPNKCPDQRYLYDSNKYYFAFNDDFKDNAAFCEAREREYEIYSTMGYWQREEGKGNKLHYNNATSAYPEPAPFTDYTELPNYVDASHDLYPKFININKLQRTAGVMAQDFAGSKHFVRWSLNGFLRRALIIIGIAKGSPQELSAALWAWAKAEKLARTGTQVYGDELLESAIDMNFVDVPLRAIYLTHHYVEGQPGHTERLTIDHTMPRDATADLTRVTWTSNNPNVATVDQSGLVTIVHNGDAQITATLDGVKTTAYVCASEHPIQAIDLGLSVKWGNRNLGGAYVTSTGIPFAWGETMPRDKYNAANYCWYMENQFTKYCEADKVRQLSLEDDAAHVLLGGKWRMPTKEEVEELISKSKVTVTKLDGVNVLKIERNGKTLYLPEVPYYNESGAVWAQTPSCYLWTNTIVEQETTHQANWGQAYCMRGEIVSKYFFGLMNFQRHYAMPIRPVCTR